VQRLGLVGLANSGKSSLFNAMTGAGVPVASHPFSTTETSVGVAVLADERLDRLAVLSHSAKTVRAGVEVVDIAGLVAGSSTGEGIGNRFLAGIREVDALVLVLRAFHDDAAPGMDDPLSSLETLELELIMADVGSLEQQSEKRRKQARLKADATLAAEADAIDAAMEHLQAGVPLFRAELSDDQRGRLANSFLLTNKPVLALVNLGEDQLEESDHVLAPVVAHLGPTNTALGACVQLEAEAAQLEGVEKTELLAGLGLGEGVIPRVARAAFELLGLRTFFTTGDKETRAWIFRAGARAPECAGVIHSDLQRGFIRAEVIHWDELLDVGGWNAAKAQGRLRIEGKEYEVRDGDVLEIRFNV
jgi:ribosome-binding ATPase